MQAMAQNAIARERAGYFTHASQVETPRPSMGPSSLNFRPSGQSNPPTMNVMSSNAPQISSNIMHPQMHSQVNPTGMMSGYQVMRGAPPPSQYHPQPGLSSYSYTPVTYGANNLNNMGPIYQPTTVTSTRTPNIVAGHGNTNTDSNMRYTTTPLSSLPSEGVNNKALAIGDGANMSNIVHYAPVVMNSTSVASSFNENSSISNGAPPLTSNIGVMHTEGEIKYNQIQATE